MIQYGDAYLNGWRGVIFYKVGRQWMHGIEQGTLAKVKVPADDHRHLMIYDDDRLLRRVRRRLRDKARRWNQLGVRYPKKLVADILNQWRQS